MKKLMVILLAGCVVVMNQGFREVAAGEDCRDNGAEEGCTISLADLAGTYSITAQGSIALCFTDTPPIHLAKCGSTGSVDVPFSVLLIGAVTRDASGNTCAAFTQTTSHLPVGTTPPFVNVGRHSVTSVT